MTKLGKALGATALGGTGATGTYGVLKLSGVIDETYIGKGDLTKGPVFLADGNSYSNETTKVGYIYGRFLLDPYSQDNWGWWQRIVDWNMSVKPRKPAYSNATSLVNFCKTLYSKEESEVRASNNKDWDKLWRNCSIFNQVPQTLENSYGDYSSNWGGQNKSNLFNDHWSEDAPEHKNNKLFWYWLRREIYGRAQKRNNAIHDKFKNIDTDYKLVEACKAAYTSNSQTTDTDTLYFSNVKEFCSINIHGEFTQYPTKPVS